MADLETTYRLVFGKELDFGLPTPKPDLLELADLLSQQSRDKATSAQADSKAHTRQGIIKSVSPYLEDGVSMDTLFSNSGRNGFNQCRSGDGWDLPKVFKYLELNGLLNAKTMAKFAEMAIEKAARE